MSKTSARILLVAVFIARGTSFLFSKTLLQSLSPTSILAVRFLLAFLILAVIFHKKLLQCDRNSFRGGIILGALYTLCMFFEMYGLRYVDTGVSSLVENMAIVMVPLFTAVLTRTLPKKKTMFCAFLAVVGVGFLSITQYSSGGSHTGMILTILAAVTYAICIMATEKVSKDAEPVTIGIIQLGTMGVLSLLASLAAGDFGMPQTGRQWGLLMLLVLLCSCFGFAFQPLGQKYVAAEEAAVLTVVNPLTASLMGILIAGESLSLLKAVGYALILTALFLYNRKARGAGHG